MVEADTRFTDEPEPGKTTEEKIKPRNVGIIMLATGLLGPVAVNISISTWSGLYFSMLFLLFTLNYQTPEGFYIYPTIYPAWGYFDIYFLMSISMMLAVYFGPRFVFSYQLVRLYKGRTTKRRTFTLGFIADCYWLFLMIPTYIMMMYSPEYFYAILPIPVALFVALLILKFRPPAKVITPWKGVDEPDKWWEKQEAAPTVSTHTPTQSTGVKAEEEKSSKPKDGAWWEEEEKDKKSSKEPASPW
jgi:hypothetical protein